MIVHTLKCEIAGIRGLAEALEETRQTKKSRYTWIKVEGAEYELPKDEIVAWLEKFGNPITELTEDKERDSSDSDDNEYYNGIYSIKMDLRTKPPQFLPISGEKIKIYYKGIVKRCVKCYDAGHLKRDCTSAKKDWMEYVSDLMFMEDLELNMLGDARKYLEKWRLENKDKTDTMFSLCKIRSEQTAQEEAQQLLRRESLKGEVQNISEILHNQSLANGPRPAHSKEKETSVSELNSDVRTPIEEEENAWKLLGSSSTRQLAAEMAMVEGKKRRLGVRKNQKNDGKQDSESGLGAAENKK